MHGTQEQLHRSRWRCCSAVIVVTLITFGADHFDMLSGWRTRLHDLLSPGRMVVLAVSGGSQAAESPVTHLSPDGPAEHQATAAALRLSELQRRQLLIANARMRNELRALKRSDTVAAALNDPWRNGLVRFETTPARIISRSGLPDRLRELIIDAGRESQLTQSELIVDGTGIVIDRGSEDELAAGARVLDGAVVVGRVAQVARWVSLVEAVDSPDFSARVQLLRTTNGESRLGAEGILAGAGNGQCVIEGIPYTEAVSVGDDVVAADVQGLSGPRLYFGRVTKAEFLTGGEWSVTVTPAADPLQLETVAVVRPRLESSTTSRIPTNGAAQ